MKKSTLLLGSVRLRQKIRFFILTWVNPQLLRDERARLLLNRDLKGHWDNQLDVHELIQEQWSPDNKQIAGEPDLRFIVFIDHELDIDWITASDLPKERTSRISEAEAVGARRCKHLPNEQVLELKRLVGQAIVSAIHENDKESLKLTKKAYKFLESRTVERSRLWTQISSHLFVLAVLLVMYLSWGKGPDWARLSNPFCLGMAGGFLGSYISILLSAGKGSWDSASGRTIHAIEVSTKLLLGTVLGGLAVAISKSVHCPPSIKSITTDTCSLFLFGVMAGFIERLIPRMISKYSSNLTD